MVLREKAVARWLMRVAIHLGGLYTLRVNRKAVLESDFSPAQFAMFGELVNQESTSIVALT